VRAAIIHGFGGVPRVEGFPAPVASDGQVVLDVVAAPLENVDRLQVSGRHYGSRAAYPGFPAVVGHSGVARLDGRLIGFGGALPPYGAFAERTLVPSAYLAYFMDLPPDVDPALACAMPSSMLASLLPLTFGARLAAGETVLVQGATGFAGRIAVQIARRLGAGRVVGTGRDRSSLMALPSLGADAVVDLAQGDAALAEELLAAAGPGGYDVILDFVWGHPTEVLLSTLVPEAVGFSDRTVRLVQIGEGAGPELSLRADALRTSGVVLMGGATGVRAAEVPALAARCLAWIASGEVVAEVERVALDDVEAAWRGVTHGRRVVVMPDPTLGMV